MSLQPATYQEALARRQKQASSPRKPMKRGKGLASRPKALKGKGRAKRPKKLTDGQLKKRVWKEFSIYIRLRGADSEGWNQCCTCSVRKFWKDLQAGHFLRGRLSANLFSETGTHPQCYSCNVGKQGEVVIYYRFMLRTYGESVIDELIAQNNQTHKWAGGELQSLLDKYKTLNAENPLLQAMTGE